MTEHFEPDWLALREAADARARDPSLAERARRWLAGRRRPLHIADLGAGAGNNPAWLAPRLPGPQHWRLVDHDRDLLARAADRVDAMTDVEASAEIVVHDLADPTGALPAETDLATASALFDLVSAEWVQALAERCADLACAGLWTLSVDGHWHFTDADGAPVSDPADRAMRERLAEHQRRDKGLGPALGERAPVVLGDAFRRRGYAVVSGYSPWQLPADGESGLAPALLDGWRRALVEQAPAERTAVETWWRDRRDRLERGELGVVVGHVDVWAEPAA
jgi:hypothetical protein